MRELMGFYFAIDDSLTIYEYRQFGKRYEFSFFTDADCISFWFGNVDSSGGGRHMCLCFVMHSSLSTKFTVLVVFQSQGDAAHPQRKLLPHRRAQRQQTVPPAAHLRCEWNALCTRTCLIFLATTSGSVPCLTKLENHLRRSLRSTEEMLEALGMQKGKESMCPSFLKGSNLVFATGEQPLPDSLLAQDRVVFRVTDVDEADKRKLLCVFHLFHLCFFGVSVAETRQGVRQP